MSTLSYVPRAPTKHMVRVVKGAKCPVTENHLTPTVFNNQKTELSTMVLPEEPWSNL